MKELKAGDKVRADFTGGSQQQDIDHGILVGEVVDGLWVIDFQKYGMMTAGVDTKGNFGFSDFEAPGLADLTSDDLIINPTSPTDWSDTDLTIIYQLSAGKLLTEDLRVEGGLFPLSIIEEAR